MTIEVNRTEFDAHIKHPCIMDFYTTGCPVCEKLALETMPTLGNMYSVGDGIFEIFYLDEARAVCSNMSGESQQLPL